MSERTDHLIERAAAKLREAGGGIPGHATATPPIPAANPAAAPPIPAGPLVPPAVIAAPPVSRARPEFKPFLPPLPNRQGAPASIEPPPATPAPAALIAMVPPPVAQMVPPPVAQLPRSPDPTEAPTPAAATPAAPASAEPAPFAPIEFRDSLPEIVQGPLPMPGAPLQRPVQSTVPPSIGINPGGSSPFAGARPAMPSALGAGPGIPAQQPPMGLQPAPRLTGHSTSQPLIGRGASQPAPMVQLDALERAGMVVARTTRTRISEEYRIAIGRILRTLHEATDVQGARNVLMVTSARPGEGKSFTALNLAGSIAQNGTDAVLLIDVDPKVKPLSDQLGLGEAHGFLDLVSDPSLRPEDLLRNTAIPNLAIMPVGTRLGGAAQTIGGTASTRPIIPTITRLARRFPKHLIMLDAPPCLSTSDPHTLAPHVGQVVLVVEAERTQRSEVEAAIDLVRVCPTITMLLNKVRMTTSHTFGAYDYFGSYT